MGYPPLPNLRLVGPMSQMEEDCTFLAVNNTRNGSGTYLRIVETKAQQVLVLGQGHRTVFFNSRLVGGSILKESNRIDCWFQPDLPGLPFGAFLQ